MFLTTPIFIPKKKTTPIFVLLLLNKNIKEIIMKMFVLRGGDIYT